MTMNENKQAKPVAWADEIIDDLQGQFDTDGITHEDSGDALIYLSQAISAVQDAAKRHPAPAVVQDYEQIFADHRRLVRELDVLINGEDGAAEQASLCDIVAQVKRECLMAPKQAEPVDDHSGLIKRIDAAIERVTQGRGLMSIPADPRSDVDLVLSECKALLQGENPPFWAADFHPAVTVNEQLLEVIETVANNLGEFAGQMETQQKADQITAYASELFAAAESAKGAV